MDEVHERIIEFLPRLRRFAYALTGDLDKADDLVQDTCERALERLHQWKPGTRLDSWMYRIAQNVWFDQYRARKVRREQTGLDEVENFAGDDGRLVTESRLTLAEVNEGIGRLPAEQQVLVAMVCVEGLSYKEAASILEIPIGTVMSRLARARQALYSVIAGEPASPVIAARER
jgi:RNA polymerase sigma-70 factor, ECF subfamily